MSGSEVTIEGHRSNLERELKMEVPDDFDLAEIGGEPIDGHTFVSIYYDTEDLRLLRAGLTLRRRVENGCAVWQLKIPTHGARLESEAPGGASDLPEPIARPIRGVMRRNRVVPIATLRTNRRGRRVDGVEVTIDEVDILDGHTPVGHFVELEAELTDGDSETLERIQKRLRRLGAHPGNGRPKLLNAVRPAARNTHADTPRGALRAYLRTQYDEVLRTDPIVRVSDDPDAVHDFRVAVRRLRSALRTARPVLEREPVRRLRAELDWVGVCLGAVRDLDVLSSWIQRESETLGIDRGRAERLLEPLTHEHHQMRRRLLETLESERYLVLLDALEGTAATPPFTQRGSLKALAAGEFRRLRKRSRHLRKLDDAGLHQARIAAKRARYAAELAAPLCGKPASRLAEAATSYQDLLGQHQDAVVAIKQLRHLATLSNKRGPALAAGRLIERQQTRKHDARKHAPEAWAKVRRQAKRTW